MKKALLTGLTAIVVGCAPAPKGTVGSVLEYAYYPREILLEKGWFPVINMDAYNHVFYDKMGVLRMERKNSVITVDEAIEILPEIMKEENYFLLVPFNEDTLTLYLMPKPKEDKEI